VLTDGAVGVEEVEPTTRAVPAELRVPVAVPVPVPVLMPVPEPIPPPVPVPWAIPEEAATPGPGEVQPPLAG